jgi:hypothetical protein
MFQFSTAPLLLRRAFASLVCLICLSLPAWGEELSQPQALFQAMERKILDSKTIRSKLAVTVDRGAPAGAPQIQPRMETLKGKLLIAGDRQLLVQLNGKLAEQKERVSISSDGVTKGEGAAPPHLAQLAKAALTRPGIFVSLVTATRPRPDDRTKGFEIDVSFPLSNLKMGSKEKLGEIESQVIEYDVAVKAAASAPFHVKLWIDPANNLPIRRLVTLDAPGEKWSVMEAYSEFQLDEPIEDREFATEP